MSQLFTVEPTISQENTKKTFETIENIASVKKNLQEAYNAEQEQSDEQMKGKNNRKKVSSETQFTSVSATLDIPRVSERFLFFLKR